MPEKGQPLLQRTAVFAGGWSRLGALQAAVGVLEALRSGARWSRGPPEFLVAFLQRPAEVLEQNVRAAMSRGTSLTVNVGDGTGSGVLVLHGTALTYVVLWPLTLGG
jgi:hypothetical protein